tara:strand:- start:428 stop:1591 length:1164 start_codon:yes stop_codon:yes gene_type:complete
MKKKIIILGSTGSIGKTSVSIVEKNYNKFNVQLLTTNKNTNLLFKQAKKFKTINLIIFDKEKFYKEKKNPKNSKFNIFNSFKSYLKNNKNCKTDIVVCGISGLSALEPLLDSIKNSKKIAIANKESIICAWPFIKKKLKKYGCELIPLDSEHFSIWKILQSNSVKNISKLLITASGGPFLNKKFSELKFINPKKAIKHPNWRMGKKISIDSATMMNKVFEVIEAKKLFNIDLSKIDIVIHSNSFVHSIIIFKNGTIFSLAHKTSMEIPIGNAILDNYQNRYKFNKKIIESFNSLNFKYPSSNQYPSLKFLKRVKFSDRCYEIILVAANDRLVKYYLDKKINYSKIYFYTNKLLNNPYFKGIINKKISSLKEIYKLVNKVNIAVDKII